MVHLNAKPATAAAVAAGGSTTSNRPPLSCRPPEPTPPLGPPGAASVTSGPHHQHVFASPMKSSPRRWKAAATAARKGGPSRPSRRSPRRLRRSVRWRDDETEAGTLADFEKTPRKLRRHHPGCRIRRPSSSAEMTATFSSPSHADNPDPPPFPVYLREAADADADTDSSPSPLLPPTPSA